MSEVYIHIYIYIHTHIRTRTYTHTYIRINIYLNFRHLSGMSVEPKGRGHARPFVGAFQVRSWSHWFVLGAILWAFIAKN